MTKTAKNSVQINNERIDALAYLTLETPMASAVLHFLMKNMGEDNAIVAPSKVLEERFKKSRTTIARATKKLIDDGWVTTTQTALGRAFVVNAQVARKQ